MVDILIYTKEETLLHKQGKQKGEEGFRQFYWTLRNLPKRIKEVKKVFFATNKFIVGYFLLEDWDCNDLLFDCITWKDIKPIPCKSFQGFKYTDKVEELKEVKPNSSQH